MIQDIFPHKFNNQYTEKTPLEDSHIIFTKGKSVLLKNQDGVISYPSFKEIPAGIKTTYLFSIDDKAFFLGEGAGEFLLSSGYEYSEAAQFRWLSPGWLCFAGITAFQLSSWYGSNRFCGRCGHELTHDKKERMLYCEGCRNMIYPKLSPAVIIGVTNGDRLLMSKYQGRQDSPRYALIAGFTEIGETLEETVRREVMEEVGIRVRNIRYYKSQPWSFTETLLVGFYCELDGDEELKVDESELALAEWIRREDMKTENDGITLTYEMMTRFKENPSEF